MISGPRIPMGDVVVADRRWMLIGNIGSRAHRWTHEGGFPETLEEPRLVADCGVRASGRTLIDSLGLVIFEPGTFQRCARCSRMEATR